jgi:hypothetical protein
MLLFLVIASEAKQSIPVIAGLDPAIHHSSKKSPS